MTPPLNAYIVFAAKAILAPGVPADKIQVLLGDDSPTITDGYGQWTAVQRPLFRAATVFQGYNPLQMTIPIRIVQFTSAGWDTSESGATYVEDTIKRLGAWAGEMTTAGPTSIVRVADAVGYAADLIPARFQSVDWVISGLTWEKAWRGGERFTTQKVGNTVEGYYVPKHNRRVYQEATVTLLQYTGFTAPPALPFAEQGGYYLVSKGGPNTPIKIASTGTNALSGSLAQALAEAIVKSDKNKKLKLRSTVTPIAPGKKVWVPPHRA